MSSRALTSPFVALRPPLYGSGATRADAPRGPVLVLGGVESAVAFCQATGAPRNGKRQGNGNGKRPGNGNAVAAGDGFLPIAVTYEDAGRGNGNGNGNGMAAAVTFDDDTHYPAWELTADRLRQLVTEQAISEVVIADRAIEQNQELVEALLDCQARGVRVRDSVTMYEKLFHKVRLESLTPQSLLYADRPASAGLYRWIKRAMDLVLSTATLLVAAPIMALAAAAVRLESKGPVIFSQTRVGLRGQTFRILKLRSMRADAEKETGPQWAQAEDDRVTRVGAFLRKHHLDELPQLINVLRGEMSLIGPRPERPCFVKVLSDEIPYFGLRHHVKPGITGWAQVEYEYGDSVEDAWEKLQYDLYYTRNASLKLDLLILLKTAKACLAADGR